VAQSIEENPKRSLIVLNSNKKMTKTKLWDLYFDINRLKLTIYIEHAEISTGRREKKWLEYFRESWKEGVNWEAQCLVYQAIVPYCGEEYVGETKISFRKRVQTHIQQTFKRAGRQRLYRKFRKIGIHKAIWLPVHTFDGNVTKYQRLREESWHIWKRNASLNALGAKNWDSRDKKTFEGELIAPRRRRHNQVKKLMDKARREENLSVEQRGAEDRRKRAGEVAALQAKGKTCAILARVARRPLREGSRFQDLKVVQDVLALPQGQFEQLVRAGFNVLDKTNKSIFAANMLKITRKHRRFVFLQHKVKNVMVNAPGAKQEVRRAAGQLCKRWSRRRRWVFIHLSLVPKGGISVVDKLDNTTEWGKKKKKAFV
jgi:hypothetical protein